MTDRRVPPDHVSHDLLLVAAYAAGDTTPQDADRAAALLAGCPECREVAADLASIATASRTLPAPQRTRDFRLSPEQAARIRSRSILDRVASALLAPRGVGRALAPTLMTLGLAALMISALPGSLGQAASMGPRDSGDRVVTGPSAPTAFDGAGGTGAPVPAGAPEVAKSSSGPTAAPTAGAIAAPVTGDSALSQASGRSASPAPGAQELAEGGANATSRTASPVPAAPTDQSLRQATVQGPPPLLVLAIVLFGSGTVLLVARRLMPRPEA
jgi:hypothetical protein